MPSRTARALRTAAAYAACLAATMLVTGALLGALALAGRAQARHLQAAYAAKAPALQACRQAHTAAGYTLQQAVLRCY